MSVKRVCVITAFIIYAHIAGIVQFIGQEYYIVGLCGWSLVAQVQS